MTQPAFDTDTASDLLMGVGQAIIADESYRRDWAGLTLVAELDGGESLFGYLYQADGEWEAELPSDTDDMLDRLLALREAMTARDGKSWKACKLTVTRPELSFHSEFEYDDGRRWHVSPANLEQRVKELRPS